MPIPSVLKDEDKDTFLKRCMGDDVMVDEYPDEKQRYAVCLTRWEEKEDKTIFTDIEKRAFNFRMNDNKNDGEHNLIGHAAVFGEYTDMGWFQERIMPGAFASSILVDDIKALFNHDPNYVLGRSKPGRTNNTLSLSEDEKGLAINIDIPNTQFAKDLIVLIQRGDISQMSFSFQVVEEVWIYEEKGQSNPADKRDLIRLKLFDISPVTYPAYPTTDVAVKSFRSWKELHKEPALSWEIGLMRKRLALQLRGGKKYE